LASFSSLFFIEMITKLFSSKFVFFGCDFVELTQNDFHRSAATAQIILLALLVSPEKS